MTDFNEKEQIQKQYRTAKNLNSRILLHQRFSTNKTDWATWVFDQYRLAPGQTILELGCGNGSIWQKNSQKIPQECQLVLSDFSAGMLAEAQKNTQDLACAQYRVIDAQSIPFADETFDVVIANHMLYHLSDVAAALKEIARILKPEGILYATTFGKNNLKELKALCRKYDPDCAFPQDALADVFGLESGQERLTADFTSVELQRYPDSLHVTDSNLLADYIFSMQNFAEGKSDTAATLQAFVEAAMKEQGFIDIQKDAGIFSATGKKTRCANRTLRR